MTMPNLVGTLLYLANCNMRDISYAMSTFARYLSASTLKLEKQLLEVLHYHQRKLIDL